MKNMSGIVALFVLFGTGCTSAASELSAQADFYVATDGNDRWSGTSPVANGELTNGPFASLDRARDAVRDLKKRKSTDIVVLVREGTYQLEKTVVFGLEDSGADDSTITYAGRQNEDRRGRKLARSADADTDYNIYDCTADPALGKAMLEKQRSDGVDAHSQAVDPLFVDPDNGDFRFQPNSPALKMGIVPIDLSKIGLRTETSSD
jgi:hypothetical protein